MPPDYFLLPVALILLIAAGERTLPAYGKELEPYG